MLLPDFICGQCENRGWFITGGVRVPCSACNKERDVHDAKLEAVGWELGSTVTDASGSETHWATKDGATIVRKIVPAV